MDSYYACRYAMDVLKKPWLAGEAAIAQLAYSAYWYAVQVLKGPFPSGENVIVGDETFGRMYLSFTADYVQLL
jgi:hypothetical protein